MFKVSSVDPSSRAEAKRLLQEIYEEAPTHWPNGLTLDHFDGGCYLIREKRSNAPVGFCGWQVRNEMKALTKSTMKEAGSTDLHWNQLMRSLGVNHIKVGYYSIGIKKAFRRNGFAKEALEKLISMKSATCDVVRAMISATNYASQALADVLGVEKLVKGASFLQPTRERRGWGDYAEAGVPLAGIGAGAKFDYDLNRFGGHLQAWQTGMRQHGERFPGMTSGKDFVVPLPEASQAIDDYTRLGKNVAESKVMGMHSGDIMANIDRFTNPEAVEHHRLFADPTKTYKDLRTHMMHKALYGQGNAWDDPAIFSPEMRSYANNLSGKTNYNMLVKGFEAKYPGTTAAERLRQAIAGVPGSLRSDGPIGEATRLSGFGKMIRSTPDVYGGNIEKMLLRPWRMARWPLLAGAGALALGGIRNLQSKRAATQDAEDAALVGASAPAGYMAYQGLLHPPKRIGVTWGQMENPYSVAVGEGHKGPGRALMQILKSDPRFQGVEINPVIRNKASILDSTPGRYNVMADTGLGTYGWDWMEPELSTHHHRMSHGITADTHMPVLTDMSPSDRPHRVGATANVSPLNQRFNRMTGSVGDRVPLLKPLLDKLPQPNRQVMMGYGPNWEANATRAGMRNFRNVNPGGMTPLIGEGQMGVLQSQVPDRASVLHGLADRYASSHPELSGQLRALASSPNKLVTVSGSGRGDYVATRARDLSEALARGGHGDTTVLAQMANAYTDPFHQNILKGTKNVIALPKMPGSDFVNLQRLADIHWGSSGTSSAAESLMQPSVLAMPDDWGYRTQDWGRWNPRTAPGTPADLERAHNLAAGRSPFEGMSPTTTWNRGNIQHLLKQPGVLRANRGQDVVDLLSNPERLSQMKQMAGQRAAGAMESTMAARKSVADTVFNEFRRNILKSRWKGGLLGAGAVGAAGYGINNLMRSRQTPPTWFDKWIYNRGA